MQQPAQICDFRNPPLDEVVLGVQFGVPTAFRATHFGEVHALFRDEFPHVIDQPRLPPQFETFGGDLGSGGMQLEFGPAPLRSRLWFISEDESHLLQFQDDRLLLNWRKRSLPQGYPRYGTISSSFASYCETLSRYYKRVFGSPLSINQAEVSYINLIEVDSFSEASEWIRVLDLSTLNPEVLALNYSEAAVDDGKPMGRMTTEIQSAFHSRKRTKAIRLALTFRGAPFGDTIDSARAFLDWGRERIVNRFCAMTTERAQQHWGRTL